MAHYLHNHGDARGRARAVAFQATCPLIGGRRVLVILPTTLCLAMTILCLAVSIPFALIKLVLSWMSENWTSDVKQESCFKFGCSQCCGMKPVCEGRDRKQSQGCLQQTAEESFLNDCITSNAEDTGTTQSAGQQNDMRISVCQPGMKTSPPFPVEQRSDGPTSNFGENVSASVGLAGPAAITTADKGSVDTSNGCEKQNSPQRTKLDRQSEIKPNFFFFFSESLKNIIDTAKHTEQTPTFAENSFGSSGSDSCQSNGRPNTDHPGEENNEKSDKSDIVEELTSFSNRYWLPEVQGQVYICHTERKEGVGGEGLKKEIDRLATFSCLKRDPPPGVWVTRLAAAGFFCPQPDSSMLRCAFCSLDVDISLFQDTDPEELHRRKSPHCPFVSGVTDNESIKERQLALGSRFIQALSAGKNALHAQLSDQKRTLHDNGQDSDHYPRSSEARSPSEVLQNSTAGMSGNLGDTAANSDLSHTVESQRPRVTEPLLSAHPAVNPHTVNPHTVNPHTVNPQAVSPQTQRPTALACTTGSVRSPSAQQGQSHTSPGPARTQSSETSFHFQTAQLDVPPPPPDSSRSCPSASSTPTEPTRQGSSSQSDSATPQANSESRPARQAVTYAQLGIYTQEPRRPDFAIASARVGTFSHWPHPETHKSEDMAEAGFYYVGQSDLVRCFYCKGGLKSWADSQHPWIEHARFFPQCPFVGQVKGQEFIDIVQELKEETNAITEDDVSRKLKERRGQGGEASGCEGGADSSDAELGPIMGVTDSGPGEDEENQEHDEAELKQAAKELAGQNRQIKQERTCKICQAEKVSILFLPCGHLAACAHCAPALRTCAICRQRVKGRVRVLGHPKDEEESGDAMMDEDEEELLNSI